MLQDFHLGWWYGLLHCILKNFAFSCFLDHQKFVSELLKHGLFLTNYGFLASYKNLRISRDSETAKFSTRALQI